MEKQNEEKKVKERTKKSKFKKFLIIYVIILIAIMLSFLIYVADSLIKYENNQIENYVESVIKMLTKACENDKVQNYIDISNLKISEFEKNDVSINEAFKQVLNNKEITYKLNSSSTDSEKPIYDIYADDELILQITLNGTQKENRLGLLTFNKWKNEKIEVKSENGLYTCNIIVPNNYKVYVNEKIVTKEQIKEKVQDEGLEQISKYVEIPYAVKYEITGLLKEPEIQIYDENGKNIKYTLENGTINQEIEFINVKNEEELAEKINGEIDVLQIAKDWSLYLTNDLSGKLNGFYNIQKYLIKDSSLEKFAYNWATGVDITFVSSHTLEKQTFTDEKISNFEIYNKNAFSCEVYLQKNLRLKSGKKIEDKMNERMYFAYYDDTQDGIDNPTWKLVNMQSIADNNEE